MLDSTAEDIGHDSNARICIPQITGRFDLNSVVLMVPIPTMHYGVFI